MGEENWDEIVTPAGVKKTTLKAILGKRDLIFLFVRRDFVKEFKQTILGPLWFIIQPLFQTVILLFVFGNIGGMGPEGIPQVSFYFGGALMWNLFAENILKSSETFRANAQIFGKVYFPRLVIPISLMLTNFLKLAVQLIIFFVIYLFEISQSSLIAPNWTIALVPFYFISLAIAGMGLGLIISSLTTKYWDLRFLVQFGIQLMMFLSAVITPYYILRERSEMMQMIVMANPASSLIEAFRHAFLGPLGGEFHTIGLLYSFGFSLIVLIVGIFIFNRVERNFMDTV